MKLTTSTVEVPPEINNPDPGAMLIVGRDPGAEEMREGRPFVGESGRLLFQILARHGIYRDQVNITNVVRKQPIKNDFARHSRLLVQSHRCDLEALIGRLKPGVIVALGNEAAYTLVPEWPAKGDSVFGAKGIKKRRGYWWRGKSSQAHKVVTTLHPAGCLPFRDPSGISQMLLDHDLGVAAKEQLERCSKRLKRPQVQVETIYTEKQALIASMAIKRAEVVACDIENYRDKHTLRCIAFATSPTHSYVFTPSQMQAAFALLSDPGVPTIWQNGQYDLHFLLAKNNVRVANFHDDTIIQWHTLMPEVAGAAKDHLGRKRGAKQTAKGLAFLSSIFSPFTEWWKDYNFQRESDAYQLCGRDTALTLHCWQQMHRDITEQGLTEIHQATLKRVSPVVMMLKRGLEVDETLRQRRIEQLRAKRAEQTKRIAAVAAPIIEANRDRLLKPHLFFKKKTCPCCRGGKAQRKGCYSCFGVTTKSRKAEWVAAAKRELRSRGLDVVTLAQKLAEVERLGMKELKETFLAPCVECDGAGQWEVLDFNPGSEQQVKDLLFNAIKLPRAAKSDEATLKNLLAHCEEVMEQDAENQRRKNEGSPAHTVARVGKRTRIHT